MKILFLILFSLSALSQVPEVSKPFPTEGSPAVPEMKPKKEGSFEKVVEEADALPVDTQTSSPAETPQRSGTSRDNRTNSFGSIMVGYEVLSSWVPFKKTISYTQIFSEKWSLEAEYGWGSVGLPLWIVDIGELSEKRYVLQARRYVGNSFNFVFGVVHNKFVAEVGNSILERMGNRNIDEFEVSGTGLTLGFGNRWQWGNGFTLGVEWLRMNIPLLNKKVENDILENIGNNNDLSEVKNVIDKFKSYPTFVLLGINIGYTF